MGAFYDALTRKLEAIREHFARHGIIFQGGEEATQRLVKPPTDGSNPSPGAGALPCGCWFESTNGMLFSLSEPKDMPPKSEFSDNCNYIVHYCDRHWEEAYGQPKNAETTPR